jgi:hypothetical protein
MFPRQQIAGELFVNQLLFQEKADELPTEVLGHPFQIPIRQVVEGSFVVESTFENQSVPMGIPSQKISIGLKCQDCCSGDGTAGRLGVEIDDHPINQTRYIGKESLIVAKEHTQRFGDGEYELTMGQVKQHLFGQVFSEQQRSFLMA